MRRTRLPRQAKTHGLPEGLHIPIAAKSLEVIAEFVGEIEKVIPGPRGTPLAARVRSYEPAVHKDDKSIKLWKEIPKAYDRLYPTRQVWVHVDYDDYRSAYKDVFSLSIPTDEKDRTYYLDHIQNREAVRLLARFLGLGKKHYSHPYLRLCPVRGSVNTSGGHSSGGEGMEKDYIRSLIKLRNSLRVKEFGEAAKKVPELATVAPSCPILYADPMDLTKMLDISPGTQELPAVGDLQHLFFGR
jgi:hypothetical protein